MGKRDPRIDVYIERSAEFAKPILRHLREVVHSACPDVEETVKWSSPTFMHHGMLCGMSAFKHHCAFGFWKGALVVDTGDEAQQAMGQFGRITSIRDLPSKRVLARLVRKACRLNEEGAKVSRPLQRRAGVTLEPPPDLATALRRNAKARATFEKFSPSHKREYIEWITEAKREETRQRRLAQAIEWLAEGKPRNWKYA